MIDQSNLSIYKNNDSRTVLNTIYKKTNLSLDALWPLRNCTFGPRSVLKNFTNAKQKNLRQTQKQLKIMKIKGCKMGVYTDQF